MCIMQFWLVTVDIDAMILGLMCYIRGFTLMAGRMERKF